MTDERIVRLLAEKVMGWVWQPAIDLDGNPSCVVGKSTDALFPWDPLQYDADSCAVLDKMADVGSQVLFHWTGTSWHVQFEKGSEWFSHEFHTDRRRAVAIAALKAAGAWEE